MAEPAANAEAGEGGGASSGGPAAPVKDEGGFSGFIGPQEATCHARDGSLSRSPRRVLAPTLLDVCFLQSRPESGQNEYLHDESAQNRRGIKNGVEEVEGDEDDERREQSGERGLSSPQPKSEENRGQTHGRNQNPQGARITPAGIRGRDRIHDETTEELHDAKREDPAAAVAASGRGVSGGIFYRRREWRRTRSGWVVHDRWINRNAVRCDPRIDWEEDCRKPSGAEPGGSMDAAGQKPRGKCPPSGHERSNPCEKDALTGATAHEIRGNL